MYSSAHRIADSFAVKSHVASTEDFCYDFVKSVSQRKDTTFIEYPWRITGNGHSIYTTELYPC